MKNYKNCKIYKGAARGKKPTLKQWYVYYYFNENYFNSQVAPKWKRFRIKEDINLTRFVHERLERAEALCDAVNELLRSGYNPFKDSATNIQSVNSNSGKFMIKDAMEWAMSKKNIGHKSTLDFKSILKNFYETIDELGYNIEAKSISKVIMREIIEKMVSRRNLSNHAYIKYKRVLGNLFEVLVEWEKLEFNPCSFKLKVKAPKPKVKMLLSENERKRIKAHLLKEHPNFFNYCMMINLTAIRPVEILRLKVGDVDLKKKTIILRADKAKDNEDRLIIIPKALEKYLNVDAPKDWYLFGHEFCPQERNKPLSRDKATHLWQKLVINDLGIDSKMYWLKHLGLTSLRQQGFDTEVVQMIAGHSSYETTQRSYITTDRPEVIEKIRNREEDF